MMNAASIAVLAAIGILFTLAVRRLLKKGTPCECGGSCRACGGSCRHHEKYVQHQPCEV